MFSPAFGVGDQFTNLIESIPGYVQTIAGWGNDLYTRYADVLQNDTVQTWINNALDAIVSWASTFARDSANGVVAIGTGLVNTFVALGFALVVAFWILMELPQLGRECMRLVNPKRHEDLEIAARHVHARHGRLHQGHAFAVRHYWRGLRRRVRRAGHHICHYVKKMETEWTARQRPD